MYALMFSEQLEIDATSGLRLGFSAQRCACWNGFLELRLSSSLPAEYIESNLGMY